ncbi:hypothetical protein M3610_10470 [Neobacillus sp. MER 74]|uniref:hypothetical protein n=1 Tax=Neobacillus sp. MER 74 TaxID=2939566 RepID=UPI0020410C81|nr:hypothetical protein [Neobacillus sp. MER 74]MCM3115712.1 hypothetical protein [Neobacillus sp. MER 74]
MEIILNTNLFTDEQKEQVVPQLEELINSLASSLNIVSLRQVIVPANFTEEIIAFQEIHNKLKQGHRTGEDGTAFGKVITYNESTDFSQTIFLHEAFLASLYSENESLVKNIVHYIQHELGHVHDNFYTNNIFTHSLLNGSNVSRLQFLLQDHSDNIWSEYFANRSSFYTLTSDILESAYENVFNQIKSVSEKVIEYIIDYNNDRDSLKLINNLRLSTDYLFYYSAHLLGFLQPMREISGDGEGKFEQAVSTLISNTFFQECWTLMDKALLNLYKKYPNWNDVYELEELNNAVLQCWNDLGIFMTMIDSELYIDVQ